MATPTEKLDLRSMSITEEQHARLKELFPEVFTEGGKIDFDRLKLTLGETVDVGKERYGMVWPGKADCFKNIQRPSIATLRPCREESVNFDSAENVIIEGDNLEVLKLLQKAYLSKVKMIYIDPPYNTGNDFIYPDNYTESLQTYLEYTGQVDAEGRKFSTNTEADGRFHSKWLNMMYPRLYLARNLLREDGVIFISIDDNELDNLKKLCNEIFGEENFLAIVVWQKLYSGKADATHFGRFHEYQLVYAKNASGLSISLLPRTEEMNSRYANPDKDPRGEWLSNDLTAAGERSGGHYEIKSPSGKAFDSPQGKHWLYARSTMQELLEDNRIWFGKNCDSFPRLKRFLSEVQQGRRPNTLWLHEEVGHTDEATKEFKRLFQKESIEFQAPKPSRLIKQMVRLGMSRSEHDIVLDFFAGSGTTAQAVIELNHEDDGNRKFILVQLPEPTNDSRFPTIAEITKERVRRVLAEIQEDSKSQLLLKQKGKHAPNFKVFKLAESNFTVWNPDESQRTASELVQKLDFHIDHVRDHRTAEDIMFELLLKSGFMLSANIQVSMIGDETVYSVADGSMLICLTRALSEDVIKAMADRKPSRVVCLDEGFAGNDQLKTNTVQLMKSRGIVFRTV